MRFFAAWAWRFFDDVSVLRALRPKSVPSRRDDDRFLDKKEKLKKKNSTPRRRTIRGSAADTLTVFSSGGAPPSTASVIFMTGGKEAVFTRFLYLSIRTSPFNTSRGSGFHRFFFFFFGLAGNESLWKSGASHTTAIPRPHANSVENWKKWLSLVDLADLVPSWHKILPRPNPTQSAACSSEISHGRKSIKNINPTPGY